MTNANHIEGDVQAMRVNLWDLGPIEPKAPKRPVEPSASAHKTGEDDPRYKLAIFEFGKAVDQYKADFERYLLELKAHDEWHKQYGGPFEMEMWAVDAREAMQRDPRRFVVSDAKKPNGGLPKGVRAGPYHDDQITRLRAISADLAAMRANDPLYGGAGVPTR